MKKHLLDLNLPNVKMVNTLSIFFHPCVLNLFCDRFLTFVKLDEFFFNNAFFVIVSPVDTCISSFGFF